jgi:hypothetical protein
LIVAGSFDIKQEPFRTKKRTLWFQGLFAFGNLPTNKSQPISDKFGEGILLFPGLFQGTGKEPNRSFRRALWRSPRGFSAIKSRLIRSLPDRNDPAWNEGKNLGNHVAALQAKECGHT